MNEPNNVTVRQSLEAFRERMQKRVAERMSRPTTTQKLHEASKQQAERKTPWLADFKTDKATYVFMSISAILTGTLGVILGLAPYKIAGDPSIYFHDDFLHILAALVYMVAFVAVTEVAFMVAKNKFHTREDANPTQHGTMIAMMILAGLSVLGTGIAGGVIGAYVLGFLPDFQEIPHSVQKWVVALVPVLIAIYAFLLAAYKLSSEDEKSERLTDQMQRTQRREAKLTQDMMQLEVDEMVMLAEGKAWMEAVERGVLSSADVAAARKAGKTLRQLEIERHEDLNDDGVIGMPSARPGQEKPEPSGSRRPLYNEDTYHPVPLSDASNQRQENDDLSWLGKQIRSQRGSILPWHCPNCDNWYVSDSCPKCGTVAPELIPTKRNNGINP